LSFASSADGRKKVLDSGGLDVMTKCLNFRKDNNLKSAGENSIQNRLSLEAFRAATSFLSGPFSDREIEIDDDFKGYHKVLSEFKQDKGADPEYVFEALTPLERRKVHIISHFLGLEHLSDGMQAVRKVIVTKKKRSVDNPMNSSMKEATDSVGFAGGGGGDEAVYRSNWQRVADTGVAKTILDAQGANFEKLSNQNVKFLVVDVILLLCEHRMLKEPEYAPTRTLMLSALASSERGLAVMGAKGMEEMIVRDGLYIPYGTRKEAFGVTPKLLKWCFKMTYWVLFWKLHSGKLSKMFESEEFS